MDHSSPYPTKICSFWKLRKGSRNWLPRSTTFQINSNSNHQSWLLWFCRVRSIDSSWLCARSLRSAKMWRGPLSTSWKLHESCVVCKDQYLFGHFRCATSGVPLKLVVFQSWRCSQLGSFLGRPSNPTWSLDEAANSWKMGRKKLLPCNVRRPTEEFDSTDGATGRSTTYMGDPDVDCLNCQQFCHE